MFSFTGTDCMYSKFSGQLFRNLIGGSSAIFRLYFSSAPVIAFFTSIDRTFPNFLHALLFLELVSEPLLLNDLLTYHVLM